MYKEYILQNKIIYKKLVLACFLTIQLIIKIEYVFSNEKKDKKTTYTISVKNTNYCYHKPEKEFLISSEEKILQIYNQWRGRIENNQLKLGKISSHKFFIIRDYFDWKKLHTILKCEENIPHIDFNKYMLLVALIDEKDGFIPLRALGLLHNKNKEQRYTLLLDIMKIKSKDYCWSNWLVIQIPFFYGDLDIMCLGNRLKNEPDRIPIYTIFEMSQKRTLPLEPGKAWYAPDRILKMNEEKAKKRIKNSFENKQNIITIRVTPFSKESSNKNINTNTGQIIKSEVSENKNISLTSGNNDQKESFKPNDSISNSSPVFQERNNAATQTTNLQTTSVTSESSQTNKTTNISEPLEEAFNIDF